MKTIIILCITICVSLNLEAQKIDNYPPVKSGRKISPVNVNTQPVNPKRSVLFTLEPHEVIYHDEYFAVAMHLNPNHFACIIEDTLRKTQTFVFNGKRIETVKMSKYDDNYYQNAINMFYFDPSMENGYGYSYNLAGQTFVNLGGKILSNVHDHPQNCQYKKGKIIFSFYSNGEQYVYTNGFIYIGGKVLGAYHAVSDLKITEKGMYYGFKYRQGNDYYYHVNGKDNVSRDDFENIPYPEYDYDLWDDSEELELKSSDNQHVFFSNYEYEYVVIDGQAFGISPALHAWYDSVKNTFSWNTIEGKALVVYEYKLR